VVGTSKDDSGVLKVTQKLYLGIMAVSCYKCDYLLNILEENFVMNGGELEWITEGLKKVDPRLRKFAELNEIMAFKPWKINTNVLEKLMKNDEKGKGWNVQQLISGASVLAWYHGLCTFVQGQGLTEDSQSVLQQIEMTKKGSSIQTNVSESKALYNSESDADTFALAYLKKNHDDDVSEGSELDFFTEEENDSQYSG